MILNKSRCLDSKLWKHRRYALKFSINIKIYHAFPLCSLYYYSVNSCLKSIFKGLLIRKPFKPIRDKYNTQLDLDYTRIKKICFFIQCKIIGHEMLPNI